MKIVEDKELKEYVDKNLYDDLSPEVIAGRIPKHEKHLPAVSKNSIRRYIKSIHGRRVENHRIKQRRKRRRSRKRPKTLKLQDHIFIDKRPKYIQKRRYVGDAEADFIVSGKTGKGIILNVKIYFCDPYSSWQKGTVENSNKYARRDIPKSSDISKYSKQFIKRLEEKLNRRIMKCLNYQTPQEVLDKHRNTKSTLALEKVKWSD